MQDDNENVCPDLLELRGWLKKKEPLNGLWHRRYCVLNENGFAIYKDDQMKEAEMVISLTPELTIEKVFGTQFPRFMITLPTSTVYIFNADSEEDLLRWITGIQNMLQRTPLLSMAYFSIISVLGRGYFGKVMLVQNTSNGKLYAIKSIQKKSLIESRKSHTVIAERNVLMKAKHPFIVQLCFAFQTPIKFYLGLEYVSGGELFFHMKQRKSLPIDDVRLYVAEIAHALSYLHSIGIVYRDLKPENVMLDAEGHIKLTDFGLAKELIHSDSTKTICGTSEYLAPEIILRIDYSYEVDWWSLGILMCEMLTETTPFSDKNQAKMFSDIVNSPPTFPAGLADDAIELISALLTKNPKNRPGFNQIQTYRFFDGLDWEKVYNREYQPRFVPSVDSTTSTKNFDRSFTNEEPADSIGQAAEGNFAGFSFAGSSFPINTMNGVSPSSPLI